jgi:lysozyme
MAGRINPEGLNLVKHFEGLRLVAYLDPVGVWTIGYGHTAGVNPGDRVSAGEAERLLLSDLAHFEAGVDGLVTVLVNENELSALVALAFNIGLAQFARSSVLKRLNADNRSGAADAFALWNKGRVKGRLVILPGLARRRAAEKALFLKPVALAGPHPSTGSG